MNRQVVTVENGLSRKSRRVMNLSQPKKVKGKNVISLVEKPKKRKYVKRNTIETKVKKVEAFLLKNPNVSPIIINDKVNKESSQPSKRIVRSQVTFIKTFGNLFNKVNNINFVLALTSLFNVKGFDYTLLSKKLYLQQSSFDNCKTVKDYKNQLLSIYNFHARKTKLKVT